MSELFTFREKPSLMHVFMTSVLSVTQLLTFWSTNLSYPAQHPHHCSKPSVNHSFNYHSTCTIVHDTLHHPLKATTDKPPFSEWEPRPQARGAHLHPGPSRHTSTMYDLPINTDIEYNCNSQYFVYTLECDYPTHISCCRAEVKDNIDRLYLNPGAFFK